MLECCAGNCPLRRKTMKGRAEVDGPLRMEDHAANGFFQPNQDKLVLSNMYWIRSLGFLI